MDLILCLRKTVEQFKCCLICLIGLTSRDMENRTGGLAQEVPEKNFRMLSRNCAYNILMKNVAAFCICLKSLPKVKVKRFEIILLTVEI